MLRRRRIQSFQNTTCCRFVSLIPDLLQIFLHVVRQRQRRVDFKNLGQAFHLVTVVVQILWILQEQPTCSFEDLTFVFVGQLAEELAGAKRAAGLSL